MDEIEKVKNVLRLALRSKEGEFYLVNLIHEMMGENLDDKIKNALRLALCSKEGEFYLVNLIHEMMGENLDVTCDRRIVVQGVTP